MVAVERQRSMGLRIQFEKKPVLAADGPDVLWRGEESRFGAMKADGSHFWQMGLLRNQILTR